MRALIILGWGFVCFVVGFVLRGKDRKVRHKDVKSIGPKGKFKKGIDKL